MTAMRSHSNAMEPTHFEHITRQGRPWLRDVCTGREIPVVAGGAEGDEPTPPAGAGTPPAAGTGGQGTEPTPPAGATFTQADLDRAAAKAAKDRDTAVAAYLADEAKKADQAKLSEADQANAKAAEAKAAADTDRAAAQLERVTAKAERKLINAGLTVPEDDTQAAPALERAVRMLALAADTDDDAIGAEVDALKAQFPALFTAAKAGATPPGPAGGPTKPRTTAPPPPAGGQGTTTAMERGAAAAARRHPPKPAPRTDPAASAA